MPPKSTKTHRKTWDIFCRVIDNYGDIGVTWRLARQLTAEHSLHVRLWVDDLSTLQHIWPTCELTNTQWLDGVEVHLWRDDFVIDNAMKSVTIDTVIEVFACHLPDNYIAHMKATIPPPQWFNLEYLSAESWVEGCHQLTSIHPQTGLKKTFFFPGFNQKTGGLLREKNLFEQRDHFIQSQQKNSFLAALGVDSITVDALVISLFSYENTAWSDLLRSWQHSTTPIIALVPEGKTLADINTALDHGLARGDTFNSGSLHLRVLPFLNQSDYDLLLWSCDINFVRGEDSFVRAQWAGKPFIWQIYVQEDDAHLVKLQAFLDTYLAGADLDLAASVSRFWLDWNRQNDCGDAWDSLIQQRNSWLTHAHDWAQQQGSQPDLAANLVHFRQKAL